MKKQLTKVLSALTAGICLCGNFVCTYGNSDIITAEAADQEKTGISGDYVYETWNQNSVGEFNYENTENNGFATDWKDISNYLATKGKRFEKDKVDPYKIDKLTIDYDIDINTDGYTIIGVEGYFTNPTALFRIVETWCSWRPPGDSVQKIAEFSLDGTKYDIYKNMLIQAFDGGYPIPTYWSVAQRDPLELETDTNLKGTIDAAAHFRAWASAGLELGKLYDVKFSLEAYQCSGSAKLNSLKIESSEADHELYEVYGVNIPYKEHEPLPTGKDGSIITVDFESENSKVGTLDKETSAKISDDVFYGGEHSMHIYSKDESLADFIYELDPYDLPVTKDGSQAFFKTGAKIYNNTDHASSFEFILSEYSDMELIPLGSELYIGKTICKPGQWTSISDLSFGLAHNTFRKYRLMITPNNESGDFYIDDFYISADNSSENAAIKRYEPDIHGDLNGDGIVNSLDLTVCRRAIIDALGENIIAEKGDVNGDFKTNVSDLVLLTRYVLGVADKLPITPNESVLLEGNNLRYNLNGSHTLQISGRTSDDETLTALARKDGTFSAEWNGADGYSCECYEEYPLESFNRYGKEFKVNYSADLNAKEDISMYIGGNLEKDYRSLDFRIYEGYKWKNDKDSSVLKAIESGKLETVTVNGIEYYIDKGEATGYKSYLYFYRKDDPIKGWNSCHIENKFELSDFLDHWSVYNEENDRVTEIGVYISSSDPHGYADFKELSFNK